MQGSTYKLKFGQKVYFLVKSAMDFFIALIMLIILSPLFLILAIAIKIDSPGPVFFVQKRIGRGGKLFNCIKFRSMSVNARHDVAGYEYKEATSYITKTGAFIRKLSLDELPQLFNILTFRMSLIGFRPSQPCENELNNARESYDLYQIRPGISGWAQVNGRDILASNPQRKAQYDAYYLEHFSFILDIKIFFMTIARVLKSSDVAEGAIETKTPSVAEYSEELLETASDISTEESGESIEGNEEKVEPLTS
jgi:O-antigen biosynthesis protein WbqP